MELDIYDGKVFLRKDDTLVQKSTKKYSIKLSFDESWNDFTKNAVFEVGVIRIVQHLEENECLLPTECLQQGGVRLYLSICGNKGEIFRITERYSLGRVLYAIILDTPHDSPDDWDIDNTATDEEVEKIIDDVFGEMP